MTADAPGRGRPRRFFRHGAIVCILGGALVLRCWQLGDAALRHYDEGVYCFAAASILSGRMDLPVEVSPPLYPLLAAGAFVLLGVAAPAAILVSAIAGTATVLVVYGLANRLAGRTAGLLAAGLLAVNPIHLFYSRMALTDALYGLLFVLSLDLIVRAWESGLWRQWCLAGVAVGLCLNTKYHGALPWLFFLVAVIVGKVAGRAEPRAPGVPRRARGWYQPLTAMLISAAMGLPWVWFIHSSMGWGAFVSHRTGYASWLPGPGPWRVYAWSLAAGASWPLVAAGLPAAGWWLKRRQFPGILLAVAILGFLLLLSMYEAYPRLLVPLIVLTCVGGGWLVAVLGGPSGKRRAAQVLVGLVLLLPAPLRWEAALKVNTGYRDGVRLAEQYARAAHYRPGVCLDYLRETPAARFALSDPAVRLIGFSEVRSHARAIGAVVLADRSATHDHRLLTFLRRLRSDRVQVRRFENPFPFLWPVTDDEKRVGGTEPDPLLPDPRYVTVYLVSPARNQESGQ